MEHGISVKIRALTLIDLLITITAFPPEEPGSLSNLIPPLCMAADSISLLLVLVTTMKPLSAQPLFIVRGTTHCRFLGCGPLPEISSHCEPVSGSQPMYSDWLKDSTVSLELQLSPGVRDFKNDSSTF
ncbi:hypothetical protein ACT691_06990 [Vibrio metschnikovii]